MVRLPYFTVVLDIAVIGGGLAGLINAISLKKAGFSVTLFEEKKYPFHRVCGEYISNEVIPYLENHDLFPSSLQPTSITQFQLTTPSGKSLDMQLDLGGFGISRYHFDNWLVKKASDIGVTVVHERIVSCEYDNDRFLLSTNKELHFEAKVVIGAFGKRSVLDKKLNRTFISHRSPYIGVKYHIKTKEAEERTIALHNFRNGYCGISKIENDTYNMCYLSHRDNLKSHSNISRMEERVLMENPYLKKIFTNSEFLFEKPEVINEISFEKKDPVNNHILMSGDSAGMITPLCGNGMAIAIHSTKILSELIVKHLNSHHFKRENLEKEYTKSWNQQFAKRLWTGRKIQFLFGAKRISEWTVSIGNSFSPVSRFLMSQTHGKPF